MPLFGPPNVVKLAERKDIPGLVKALYYDKGKQSDQVRLRAARALGNIGEPAYAPVLAVLDQTSRDQTAARQGAIWALGEFALRAPEEAIRCQAFDKQLQIISQETIADAKSVSGNLIDATIQQRNLQLAARSLDELIRFVEKTNFRIEFRRWITFNFWRPAAHAASPELRQRAIEFNLCCLTDSEPDIRYNAVRALPKYVNAIASRELREEFVKSMILMLNSETLPLVRKATIESLEAFAKAEENHPFLINHLDVLVSLIQDQRYAEEQYRIVTLVRRLYNARDRDQPLSPQMRAAVNTLVSYYVEIDRFQEFRSLGQPAVEPLYAEYHSSKWYDPTPGWDRWEEKRRNIAKALDALGASDLWTGVQEEMKSKYGGKLYPANVSPADNRTGKCATCGGIISLRSAKYRANPNSYTYKCPRCVVEHPTNRDEAYRGTLLHPDGRPMEVV